MKLPMILLWKAVLLEVVVQGVQALPKSSDLLKILVQMAPSVAWLQKMAPKVCKKTHEDLFCRWHREKFFIIFLGENLLAKVAQKRFRASLGKYGQKNPSHPPKFACSCTYEKEPPPRCPPSERTEGKCTRHAYILRRPCACYSTRTLYSLL